MGRASIRPATAADVPVLARLRYDLRATMTAPVEAVGPFLARCERWMREHLRPDSGWRCWVAEVGDERPSVAGTIWLHTMEKIPNPVAEPESHGYVTSFFVRADLRGTGIGSALLDVVLREGERQGLDALILWPTPRSRSLYERHGFAVRDDVLERRAGASR